MTTIPMLHVYVSDGVYLWLMKNAEKKPGKKVTAAGMAGRMLRERYENERS